MEDFIFLCKYNNLVIEKVVIVLNSNKIEYRINIENDYYSNYLFIQESDFNRVLDLLQQNNLPVAIELPLNNDDITYENMTKEENDFINKMFKEKLRNSIIVIIPLILLIFKFIFLFTHNAPHRLIMSVVFVIVAMLFEILLCLSLLKDKFDKEVFIIDGILEKKTIDQFLFIKNLYFSVNAVGYIVKDKIIYNSFELDKKYTFRLSKNSKIILNGFIK